MSDLWHQTQEFLHSEKTVGDCWRAALACLLEIPIGEVPHFAQLYPSDIDGVWWDRSVEFVESTAPGTSIRCLAPTFPVYERGGFEWVIATGPSPRGDFMHAVLVSEGSGALEWDPHPDRSGLAGPIVEIFALVYRGYS